MSLISSGRNRLRAHGILLAAALLCVAGWFVACMTPERLVPRMTSEVVELTEKENGDFHVRVTYYFAGPMRGFEKISFPETDWYRLRNFRMRWNGRELPVVRREAGPGREFRFNGRAFTALHTASAGRVQGDRHVMINTYDFTPPAYDAKGDDPRWLYVEYILRTGAAWSGSIGRVTALARFKRPICESLTHLPGSYRGKCVNPRLWRMELTDIALDRDIQMLIPRR